MELVNEYRDAAVGPDETSAAAAAGLAEWEPTPRSRLSKVMWELLFWLATTLLDVGVYMTFRFDGPPTVWIPLMMVGASLCIAYVFRD